MKITLGGIYFSFGEKKILFGVILTEEIRFETKNKSKFVLQFARLFVYHEDSPDSPHNI